MKWSTKCKKSAQMLSEDTRQKFMDLVNSGKASSKSLKICGITFEEAHGIMILNVERVNFLIEAGKFLKE